MADSKLRDLFTDFSVKVIKICDGIKGRYIKSDKLKICTNLIIFSLFFKVCHAQKYLSCLYGKSSEMIGAYVDKVVYAKALKAFFIGKDRFCALIVPIP